MADLPSYLKPYVDATRQHGAGFESLLWASPRTQAARFDAIRRILSLHGRSVLDVGCGRADLLDHLLASNVTPSRYVGIEAVGTLAEAARQKNLPNCAIVEEDVIARPLVLEIGADVIVFCGSLNTMADRLFYDLLGRAFRAARHSVVFNFLCSSSLAAADYLTWHRVDDVLAFAHRLTPIARRLEDYIEGDCTICMTHPPAPAATRHS